MPLLLWKESGKCTERLLLPKEWNRGSSINIFRNGSEMRETVPLWKGSWEAMLPEGLNQWCGRNRRSATAAKCGKRCRCGKGHERQCCPEGLNQWCGRKGHSATAAKCGKRCRCGRGHERQCCPEGLNQWCGRKGHSTTAAKCGKRCRCGEKGRKGQDSDREEVTGKRWRYVAKERERK